MTTLHLGVIDIPYSDKQAATVVQHWEAMKRGKPLTKSAARASVTTGDVAQFLEDRYHVMEVFYEEHQAYILAMVEMSVKAAIERLRKTNQPETIDPFGAAISEIENRFKRFLSLGYVENVGIPGVPTKAALKGVSHRRKHPYAKSNPRRPSFIDTGIYENSFKAWVE